MLRLYDGPHAVLALSRWELVAREKDHLRDEERVSIH